jgi:hypothetical protein
MVTKLKANQRKEINLLVLIFILGITSCARIQVTTPSSRYITPEAKGKLFNGEAAFEQQAGTEATLNFDNDKLDNELILRNNVTPLALRIDLGIVEKIDFIIKGNSNAPTVYTVKYQFLGENQLNAGKGNHSLAATLGYGQEDLYENDDSDFFEEDDIEAELNHKLLEASVIYGYRPHEDTLLYTTILAQKQDVSFILDAPSNASLDKRTFSLHTWSYGANIGAVRYFDKTSLSIEANVQRTDWTNNDPMTYAFLTAAIGFAWD